MIVVDTSALLAILQNEAEADAIEIILDAETEILMSASTLAEALIVAGRRGKDGAMAALIARLRIEIIPVTAPTAERVAAVYSRWGKGVHPARLNFGDCFAYELAATRSSRLLFVGRDFSQTDIASALPA